MQEVTRYLAAQFNRTSLFLRNENFSQVISSISSAYNFAVLEFTAGSQITARLLLVCCQAFYSSVSCIARGTPSDSAGPSRRALEAARTALAVAKDPENLQKWTAFQARLARWEIRQDGGKPPSLKIQYSVLEANKLGQKMATLIGILSDASVHFTPEFISQLNYKHDQSGKSIYLEFLEERVDEQARAIKLLSAIHFTILRAFDQCCGGALARSRGCREAMQDIEVMASELWDKYPFKVEPELERKFRDAASSTEQES
jgi:hypothetical protein